jgi:hypothetical protein
LIGLSINWGLSAELVISVIPPNRRSTAKAFFHLISHALGDAPAPLIVGGLSDVIKKYEYDGIGRKYKYVFFRLVEFVHISVINF